MKLYLKEDSQLYKGIFWITDSDNIYSNQLYFQIPCDTNGNILADIDIGMSSKSTLNFNHEKVWNQLEKKYTGNLPYNYYPRGRVEINNGKAIIYLSPWINNQEVIDFIKDKYNLTVYNGIKSVRAISDGSEHYKCYLD